MKSLVMSSVLLVLLLGGPIWIVAGEELDEAARRELCQAESLARLDWLRRLARMSECLSDGDKLTFVQYPALAALFRDRLFGLHSLPRDLATVTQVLGGVQMNLQQVVNRLSALERK